VFVFTALSDSAPTARDTVTDFVHGTDVINLSALDAYQAGAGNQVFAFAGNNASAVAHSITWYESNGNTIVQADVSGDATADFAIVLKGINLSLTATDFLV